MARSLGTLTISLLLKAGSFETDAGRAARIADKEAKAIARSFDAAGKAIGLALAAGITTVGAAVVSAINHMDDLSKAAQRANMPTEQFSALAHAANLADVSMQDLQGAMGKLAKAQGEALNSTSTQAKMFDALGISAKNADGSLRDTADVFLDFADKFQKFKGSPEIMAAGMQLFGRSFQNLIPLLKDGSAGLRDAMQEARDLGLVLSTAAGANAEQFNDNLSRMKTLAGGLGMSLASELLPRMVAFTDNAVEMVKAAGGAEGIMRKLSSAFDTALTVAKAAGVYIGTTYAASIGIAAARMIAAAAATGTWTAATLGLTGAMTALRTAAAFLFGPAGLIALGATGMYLLATRETEADKAAQLHKRTLDEINGTMEVNAGLSADLASKKRNEAIASLKAAEAVLAEARAREIASEKYQRESGDGRPGFSSTGKSLISEKAGLIAELQKEISDLTKKMIEGSVVAAFQLNEPPTVPKPPKLPTDPDSAAKRAADEMARWRDEIEKTRAQLEGPLSVAQLEHKKRLDEIATALKAGTINEAQATEARAQAGEQYRRQTEEIEKNLAAQRERADVMGRLRAGMQEEVRLSAMSVEQRRVEETVLRAMADAKQHNVEISEAEARAVVAAADAQIRANEDHIRSLEDLRQAGVGAFQSMAQAMGDFVGRGFRGVKDMWSQIKDAFKRGVSDVVAIMLNASFVRPLQNWLGQMLGMGGSQGMGGLASGQGGLGAIMNNGFDRLLSGFAGLFGRGGAATTSIAQGVGSLLPDAVKAGAQMASSAGVGSAGGGMLGGAGAFAKAIPVIGWIAAGMQMAGNMYSKGWDINGQRNDVARGTLATGDLGLVISAGMTNMLDRTLRSIGLSGKWASILSGSSLLAAAFGRKKPEITGQGITGNYGFDGFSGQSYADVLQKGGWFRSDKRWTQYGAMDAGLDQAFDAASKTVRDAAEQLAKQAGVDISAQLAGVSVSIGKVQLSQNEDEARKQVEGLLDTMVDTLSQKAVQAMGFGRLLDDGYKASEIMTALSASIQLVTGVAGNLDRSLTALESERVQLTVEWFEKFAESIGGTLSDAIQKAMGLINDYASLMSGVRTQIATRGLNEYQKSQLDVELAYRSQVKQANELAKALGLSGARAEDLAAIEQLRALNMADLAQQYAKNQADQNKQWLAELGLSDLSPLRDDQKLAEGMNLLREAVGAGDAQRAQKLAEQVLGLGRDLYASGADYAALYNQVAGLVGNLPAQSMEELQGLTNEQLATLADLVGGLPEQIAQELAALLVAPPPATTEPQLPPAPTPQPPPPSGGGGGGSDPGDRCVAAQMVMDDGTLAEDADAGNVHATHDPAEGFMRHAIRARGEAVWQPCVRLVTAGGAALVCSASTPFTAPDAPADLPEYTTLAPDMLGRDVIVERDGLRLVERVVDVQDVGMHLVIPLDFGGRSFPAGEDAGALIYSHNMQKAPDYNNSFTAQSAGIMSPEMASSFGRIDDSLLRIADGVEKQNKRLEGLELGDLNSGPRVPWTKAPRMGGVYY